MMEAGDQSSPAQLPDEMFSIIKAASCGIGPRLGRLALPGRKTIETPHYLGITSRGVVPHLTQDNFARETSISGVYVGLEDFIERAPSQVPPLYEFRPPDGSSPLRRFVALPDETLLVLGARRTPPVAAPAANPNTNTTISALTSVGFRTLQANDFTEAVERLRADIVVGLGDIPYGRALGSKRIEKATDRNIQWMQDHLTSRKDDTSSTTKAKLFAPLLPVTCANQQFYIEFLTQNIPHDVPGLAIYSMTSLEDIPDTLGRAPRLGFTTPTTPHDALYHIALGLDMVTIPFVNSATDAGIALAFSFPVPYHAKNSSERQDSLPLGIDMWPSTHATDLSSLVEGCKCYACTKHHRAYLQHLLVAKEMLGWVLLQIHNHCVMDHFFAGVRRSISEGTFKSDMHDFGRAYESQLPEKTGREPRVRGYQFKSERPGEPKKNIPPFSILDDRKNKLAESTPPSVDADASELEDRGFAEKKM